MYLYTNYGTTSSDEDFLLSLVELNVFLDSTNFDPIFNGGDFSIDFGVLSYRTSPLSHFMSEESCSS